MEEEQKKSLIKWCLIGVAIILVLWFIVAITSNASSKKKTLDDYVSELASYQIPGTEIKSSLPGIHLDSDDAKQVNEIIKEAYNTAIKNKYTQFTYEASVGEKYLSIALITSSVDTSTNTPYSSIKTYTFDKKTGQRMDDNELLKTFSVTLNEIGQDFEKQMRAYYEEELESFYFNADECDYQCFLRNRGIYSYQDNISLFVLNDKLVYYRPFLIYSKWQEEDFYRYEDFLFEID